MGAAHQTQGCTVCHANDNTDRTVHAQGPARPVPPNPAQSDAAMGTPDGATYTNGGTAFTDNGFSYTLGTCGDMTTGCHNSAVWGDTFGCTLCHGDPPNLTRVPSAAVCTDCH